MYDLRSGVSFIALGTFLAMSFLSQNMLALIICNSMLWWGIGFLRYKFPPASIYLGDTGGRVVWFYFGNYGGNSGLRAVASGNYAYYPILILGLPQ